MPRKRPRTSRNEDLVSLGALGAHNIWLPRGGAGDEVAPIPRVQSSPIAGLHPPPQSPARGIYERRPSRPSPAPDRRSSDTCSSTRASRAGNATCPEITGPRASLRGIRLDEGGDCVLPRSCVAPLPRPPPGPGHFVPAVACRSRPRVALPAPRLRALLQCGGSVWRLPRTFQRNHLPAIAFDADGGKAKRLWQKRHLDRSR
jgi:hypothetical protein